MDFIPIEPDDDLGSILESACRFPLRFVSVNNPGDYENESIVLKADEDISSLSDYIFTYMVEDATIGIPDYSKCRLLTFDDLDLQKGSFLQIFTRPGEDTTAINYDTSNLHKILYWGLPEPIWDKPHSSLEIIERRDSYSVGFSSPEP